VNNTTVQNIADDGPGGATTSSQIIVSGLNANILDVDVRTNLVHPDNDDLELTLFSPAGSVVTLGTGNPPPPNVDNQVDVFNGTVWDDDAGTTNPPGPVTDATYVSGTPETPLVPEEALAAFIGENPNGTWTLLINDTVDDGAPGGTEGTLNSWHMTITTLTAPPVFASNTFTTSTPVTIPDNNASFTNSTLAVTGLGTYLYDVNAQTFIQHNRPADLDVFLQSAGGTQSTLTTGNGGANVNAFNGTVWDDDAGTSNAPGPVTDSAYASGTTETPLVPEEAMGAFIGENPNGTWTLAARDIVGGEQGSVNQWSVTITTASCGQTDLSLAKADSQDPVRAGQPLRYTLTVKNNGTAGATGVQVIDNLPTSVTFISATTTIGSCALGTANTVNCTLGTVNGGVTVTINIDVTPNTPGQITNFAAVSSATGDSSTANNSDTELTTVNAGGPCDLSGTNGADVIIGTHGSERICSLGGNDGVRALGGNDTVILGRGDDVARLGGGNDVGRGGGGGDFIAGGPGNDEITSGSGNDNNRGGGGSDVINCGPGFDAARGGPGNDRLATSCENAA
jgi:uncharacterized repeat protein (TIGR01451 family)